MNSLPENIEAQLTGFSDAMRQEADEKIQGVRHLLTLCESPAEQLFLASLARQGGGVPMLISDKPHLAMWLRWGPFMERFVTRVYPQMPLTIEHQDLIRGPQDYRVDFLVHLERLEPGKPTTKVRFVVEIDGHDYHERTKEQAARDRLRDRMFTQAGYTVLRYTASEVYNDPVTVTEELISLIGRCSGQIVERMGP